MRLGLLWPLFPLPSSRENQTPPLLRFAHSNINIGRLPPPPASASSPRNRSSHTLMEMDIPRPAHATLADVEGLFEILFFWRCADAQNREFRIFRVGLMLLSFLLCPQPHSARNRRPHRPAPRKGVAFCCAGSQSSQESFGLRTFINIPPSTTLMQRRWKDDACGSKTFHRHGPWPCTWRLRWEGTLDEGRSRNRRRRQQC